MDLFKKLFFLLCFWWAADLLPQISNINQLIKTNYFQIVRDEIFNIFCAYCELKKSNKDAYQTSFPTFSREKDQTGHGLEKLMSKVQNLLGTGETFATFFENLYRQYGKKIDQIGTAQNNFLEQEYAIKFDPSSLLIAEINIFPQPLVAQTFLNNEDIFLFIISSFLLKLKEKNISDIAHETLEIFYKSFSNLVCEELKDKLVNLEKDESAISSHLTKSRENFIRQMCKFFILLSKDSLETEKEHSLLNMISSIIYGNKIETPENINAPFNSTYLLVASTCMNTFKVLNLFDKSDLSICETLTYINKILAGLIKFEIAKNKPLEGQIAGDYIFSVLSSMSFDKNMGICEITDFIVVSSIISFLLANTPKKDLLSKLNLFALRTKEKVINETYNALNHIVYNNLIPEISCNLINTIIKLEVENPSALLTESYIILFIKLALSIIEKESGTWLQSSLGLTHQSPLIKHQVNRLEKLRALIKNSSVKENRIDLNAIQSNKPEELMKFIHSLYLKKS